MQSITNIFNDNRKIGILLLSLGLLFLFLGVMLLFDDVLLCMGNILFLSAFPFLIGFARTLRFFNPLEKSDKWKGVLCFFVGVVIVLFRHPIIGMIIEVYGMALLFGRFIPMVITFLSHIPFIGGILDQIPYVNSYIHKKGEDLPRAYV